MDSMMGWMMGIGLLGWVLVVGLLATIVVLLFQLVSRSSRGGPSEPPAKPGPR
ncbi:MAG: hypothetical protein ACT4P4_29075 [Betaproteobacteria bacterium]